jgi:hypothetical protein
MDGPGDILDLNPVLNLAMGIIGIDPIRCSFLLKKAHKASVLRALIWPRQANPVIRLEQAIRLRCNPYDLRGLLSPADFMPAASD